MRKYIIAILFATLLPLYVMAGVDLKWIDFKPTVDKPQVMFKIGIKSDSQITGVKVSVDGNVVKGLNAVSNDGFDMVRSIDVTLKEGENTIVVSVSTKKGDSKFAKVIQYVNPNNNNVNNGGNNANNGGNNANNIKFDIPAIKEAAYIYDDPKAQYLLGLLYLDGAQGLSKDLFESSLWFKKAAQSKYPDAMYEYACALIEGRGVLMDKKEGFAMLEEAAENNQQNALLKLGICYETGEMVDRDITKARAIYQRCTLPEAKRRLDALK